MGVGREKVEENREVFRKYLTQTECEGKKHFTVGCPEGEEEGTAHSCAVRRVKELSACWNTGRKSGWAPTWGAGGVLKIKLRRWNLDGKP